MKRLAILAISVFILLSDCGPSRYKTEEDKRREAFQRQLLPAESGPDLDKAGEYIRAGSSFYFQAVAEENPMKRKNLFLESANKYQKALDELIALRNCSKNQREKEELSLIIKSLQEDIKECYRQMPITGE